MAVITTNDAYGVSGHAAFSAKAQAVGLTELPASIMPWHGTAADVTVAVRKLLDIDARIIYLHGDPYDQSRIIEEAVKQKAMRKGTFWVGARTSNNYIPSSVMSEVYGFATFTPHMPTDEELFQEVNARMKAQPVNPLTSYYDPNRGFDAWDGPYTYDSTMLIVLAMQKLNNESRDIYDRELVVCDAMLFSTS